MIRYEDVTSQRDGLCNCFGPKQYAKCVVGSVCVCVCVCVCVSPNTPGQPGIWTGPVVVVSCPADTSPEPSHGHSDEAPPPPSERQRERTSMTGGSKSIN